MATWPATEIPADQTEDRGWLWVGTDDRGLQLEVIAIETAEMYLVIHVMPTSYPEVNAVARRKKQELGPIGPDVDLDVEDVRDSQGRRIDAEYVDRVVARAVGRPSLTGVGRRSPHVSFRVSESTRAAAEARAAAEGKTVSQVAREALERYVS